MLTFLETCGPRLLILGLILWLVPPSEARGQGASVAVHLDRTEITIGDLVNLEVIVTADTTLEVVLPATEDLLGVFEVKDFEGFVATIDKAGRRVYRSWYYLTTWTTGRWLVPPFVVTFTDSTGRSGSASSDSLFIEVKSILAEAGADTVDIRDLKPLYELPVSRAIYYYIAGAALVAALVVWYILRRRRRKEEAITGDTRTPWERAFDDLTELKNSHCLHEQKWREWYFALTEIYRRYLDGRFGVDTLEATTTEVKLILPTVPLGEPGHQAAADFLDLADLVKFARLIPPPSQPQDDFDYVWKFVEQTKVETLLTKEETPTVEKTGTTG